MTDNVVESDSGEEVEELLLKLTLGLKFFLSGGPDRASPPPPSLLLLLLGLPELIELFNSDSRNFLFSALLGLIRGIFLASVTGVPLLLIFSRVERMI